MVCNSVYFPISRAKVVLGQNHVHITKEFLRIIIDTFLQIEINLKNVAARRFLALPKFNPFSSPSLPHLVPFPFENALPNFKGKIPGNVVELWQSISLLGYFCFFVFSLSLSTIVSRYCDISVNIATSSSTLKMLKTI